ncbi:UNKNOWN [Stylonychia lemnae]|uniref:Uncharacterized protein n=1 Tax=Stylonychia lemnae TaxID=5949 RepID=A0A078B8S4_STYLE|nr:UNKNOWN [Stylonychia lemnae]|eukprot:CDW89697.1 UNKNOWN [Stylonychia lemnae]
MLSITLIRQEQLLNYTLKLKTFYSFSIQTINTATYLEYSLIFSIKKRKTKILELEVRLFKQQKFCWKFNSHLGQKFSKIQAKDRTVENSLRENKQPHIQNLNHFKQGLLQPNQNTSTQNHPKINISLRALGQINTNQPPTPAPIQTPHTQRNMSSMKPPLESSQKLQKITQQQASHRPATANPRSQSASTQQSHVTQNLSGAKSVRNNNDTSSKKGVNTSTLSYQSTTIYLKQKSQRHRSLSLGQTKKQDSQQAAVHNIILSNQTPKNSSNVNNQKVSISSCLKNSNKSNVSIKLSQQSFTRVNQNNDDSQQQPIKKLKIIKLKKKKEGNISGTTDYQEKRDQIKIIKASQISRNTSAQRESKTIEEVVIPDQLKQKLNIFYKSKTGVELQKVQNAVPLTARNVTRVEQPFNSTMNANSVCSTARNIIQPPQQIFTYPQQPQIQKQLPTQQLLINQKQQQQFFSPAERNIVSSPLYNNNGVTNNPHLNNMIQVPQSIIFNQEQQEHVLLQSELTQNSAYSLIFNQLQDMSESHENPKDLVINHLQNNNSTDNEDSQDFINNLIKFNVDMQQFIHQKDQLQCQIENMRVGPMPQFANQMQFQQYMMLEQQNQQNIGTNQQLINSQTNNNYMGTIVNKNQQFAPQQSNNQYQQRMPQLDLIEQFNDPKIQTKSNMIRVDEDVLSDQYYNSPQNNFKKHQQTQNSQMKLYDPQMNQCYSSMTVRTSGLNDDEEEMEYSSDEGGNLLESQTSNSFKPLRS